jgi:murein DD-endopeptidase MepM/ murein hydrolase activator NlpD
MKWLLTFLIGVLVGAGVLFAYLRQVPHEAPPAVAATHALPAPPAAPDPLAASLPPAPTVQPDLTEADLPQRPEPVPAAVGAVPNLVTASTSTSTSAPGKLLVPVEGIKASELADTFNQPRGKERHHEALDIMAPKGRKVLAAADGKVVKLFTSKPGGLTVYQFDPTGTYAYYYAHLDRYAEGLKEGAVLKRGDLVGYVGTTGNADPAAPHLHFAVFALSPEKQWWKGTPVNPFPLLEN